MKTGIKWEAARHFWAGERGGDPLGPLLYYNIPHCNSGLIGPGVKHLNKIIPKSKLTHVALNMYLSYLGLLQQQRGNEY